MTNKLLLVQIFVLVFAVGMFTQCSGRKNETITGSRSNSPADEAKIKGNIPDYEIKETTLEYLQSLEIPEINVVFEKNNSNLQPPADVKEILNAHWKEAVKFFYEEQFNKPTNGQESGDRYKAWAVYCGKTQQKLQTLKIEAPNGKRNISPNEAGELYSFLNEAAVEVVIKVEGLK